eukprot:1148111-Pleurochrysis_carterae.AAC.2
MREARASWSLPSFQFFVVNESHRGDPALEKGELRFPRIDEAGAVRGAGERVRRSAEVCGRTGEHRKLFEACGKNVEHAKK